MALQKQDYNLAAHVLVYGLVKASVTNSRSSPSFQRLQNRHGSKKKKQEKK
jgi:hypothetical protein